MDEAHMRMHSAGLRFSTLGTGRHRAAYQLYQRQGYETVFAPAETFVRREDLLRSTALRAECAGVEKLSVTDDIFQRAASGHLGFTRRQKAFLPMLAATGDLNAKDVWLLWSGDEPVGYAIAHLSKSILKISNLLLVKGIDVTEAVSALAHVSDFYYLQMRVDAPSIAADLQRAGYTLQHPNWSVFMIKPLYPDVTIADARRLLGIGTEVFLISWMDVT
jgi:predicted acetyltransferase